MTDSTKRHPVILFPGIAGSRLKTKNFLGVKSPLWFNFAQMSEWTNLTQNQITAQEEDLTVSRAIVASDKTEADIQEEVSFTPVESWQKHMRLKADGKTPEIEGDNDADLPNREVEGLKGIKNVNDPLGEALPNEDMRYFHNLVERLKKEYSYTEDKDLIGHPYDWRVAPGGLEQRYQTFTKLKDKIEELYTEYHLPVVLIAHSMGNRVVQYFLNWVEASDVQEAWVYQYIERYIAISPPWIGSPQAIYRLSDSPIILPSGNTQIALAGMKDVLQSFSSIPWLFPVEGQYQYFNTEKNKEGEYIFGYLANSASRVLDEYQPITVQQTLEKANAQTTTLAHQTNFYKNDPLITDQTAKKIGSELVKCPPVQKLDVIYSTGFPTPVGAYYQETDSKLEIATTFGSDTPIPYLDKTGLVIKKGIILETPATTQQIEVEVADGAKQQNSGDLVVPYGSLTYFKKWQKAEPNRHIVGHEFSAQPTSGGVQYPSVNHNAIVAHPDAITKIIQLLSESNA